MQIDRIEKISDSFNSMNDSSYHLALLWFQGDGLNRTGNSDSAEVIFNQLLERLRAAGKIESYLGRASLVHHALVMDMFGAHEESTAELLEAYEAAKKAEDQRMQFDIAIIFARWFEELGDWDRTWKWVEEGKVYAEKNKDPRTLNRIYNRIASIYRVTDQPDSAMTYALRALDWGEKAGPDGELGTTYLILGLLNRNINPEKSILYFQNYQKLVRQWGNPDFINGWINLAGLYLNSGRLEEAGACLDSCEKYLKMNPSSSLSGFFANLLSRYHEESGQFDSALVYSRIYYEKLLRKEAENRRKQVEIVTRQYNDEKQKAKIREQEYELESGNRREKNLYIVVFSLVAGALVSVLLLVRLRNRSRSIRRQNELIRSINTSLETSLQDQEILLREVNHRVKNNLQMIVSFTELAARNSQEEGMKQVLDDIRKRVRSIGLVHELLLRSEQMARIPLDEYAQALFRELYQLDIHNSVRGYTVNCNGISLDLGTTMYLGILLNEMVLNAIEHAGTKEAPVFISLKVSRDGKELKMVFSDDGKGFSPLPGQESRDSVGFYLIRAMARQLQGEIRFENRKGATYILIFPFPGEE